MLTVYRGFMAVGIVMEGYWVFFGRSVTAEVGNGGELPTFADDKSQETESG